MSIYKNNLALAKPKLILILVLAFMAVLGVLLYLASREYSQKKAVAKYEEKLPAIKITLFNGCGFEGVANDVSASLADKNVDIIQCENADKFIYDQTIIVVKNGDQSDLQRLMKITGIKNVVYAESENYPSPFIIIIGKDYMQIFKNKKVGAL